MEEICTTLCDVLASDGAKGYKIYYEEELSETLPDGMRNRETLEAALKNLQSSGCIDVKYARGDVFCIAYRKKYTPPEREREADAGQPAPTAAPAISKKIYAAVALCAFFGGALGGCVAAILGTVL